MILAKIVLLPESWSIVCSHPFPTRRCCPAHRTPAPAAAADKASWIRLDQNRENLSTSLIGGNLATNESYETWIRACCGSVLSAPALELRNLTSTFPTCLSKSYLHGFSPLDSPLSSVLVSMSPRFNHIANSQASIKIHVLIDVIAAPFVRGLKSASCSVSTLQMS